MIRRTERVNGGGIIFALILILVGAYYFLRNTLGFDLGELDEKALWPIVALALGAWILYRSVSSRSGDQPHQDGRSGS